MINRREFLERIGAIILLYSPFSKAMALSRNKKYIIDNPYSSVNWNKVKIIPSTSHIHITNQSVLNKAVVSGYKNLPISNYYPSAPFYPIEDMKAGMFREKQDFGAASSIVEGKFYEGPIRWSDVIMDKETGWYDSLSDELKKELPFKTGDKIFTNIPSDITFSPNAEHHSFSNARGSIHLNSLGSFFSSGTFDAHDRFGTLSHGYSYGAGEEWQKTCKKILDNLQFEDGGGITINHPTWGKMTLKEIVDILDFDPRVLGIEVIEDSVWSDSIWDEVLKTGRRCLGFSVPDWGNEKSNTFTGFNMLLVNNNDEHSCMKAYRDGAFFGSEFNNNFFFTKIILKKNKLFVSTNRPSTIKVISNGENVFTKDNTNEISYKIPFSAGNIPSIKYLRVEAINENNERIFSQPIRFIFQD